MKTYSIALIGFASLVTACGLVSAVLTMPVAASIALVAVGAAVGATVYVYLPRGSILCGSEPVQGRIHSAGAGAAVCLALGGLIGFMGPMALGLVVVVGIGTFPLVKRNPQSSAASPIVADTAQDTVEKAIATDAATDTTAVSAVPPPAEERRPPVLTEWSTEQLCWAWRCSFVRLQRSSEACTGVSVAQQRQFYLDELERRDPRGFSAWMTGGARAASDPGRYLVSRDRRPRRARTPHGATPDTSVPNSEER
jgi:hypothetical protein